MEPMVVGTPTNSGPSSPATTPTGSPYLPPFLLGDPQTPISNSTSPKTKRVHFEGHSSGGVRDHVRHDVGNSNQLLCQSKNNNLLNSTQYSQADKGSGPPICGLFDTVNSPPFGGNQSQSNDINNYLVVASKNYAESRISPIRHVDVADTTWVTVFGYPPSAASFILSQLSHCGSVMSTRSPAKGNWMHIQFSSKLEARRALTYNGKVFASTVMIGVIPCRDQGIMSEYSSDKENQNCAPSPISTTSSVGARSQMYPEMNTSAISSSRLHDASIYESPIASPGRFINARPLQTRGGDTEVLERFQTFRQLISCQLMMPAVDKLAKRLESFQNVRGEMSNKKIYTTGNTPQKNTGLVAKAMEFVFGW